MKKILEFVALLTVSFSCVLAFGGGRDRVFPQKVFYVGRNYTGAEVSKTIPLYKFKQDMRGLFLERFCDTLARNDFFPLLTLNEVEDLHTPHQGNIKDFLYIQSEWADSTLFQNANGAIMLAGNEVLLFRNISDSTKMALDIEEIDSLSIRYGVISEAYSTYINDSELRTLLHLKDDGSVDPVLIYRIFGSINKYPALSRHFDWIPAFYTAYHINFEPGYLTQKDLFEYIFCDKTIHRKEVSQNGQYTLIFSFNDIIRVKNWKFPFDKVSLPIIQQEYGR